MFVKNHKNRIARLMNDNGGQKDKKRRCQFIKFNYQKHKKKFESEEKLNPGDAINVINQN